MGGKWGSDRENVERRIVNSGVHHHCTRTVVCTTSPSEPGTRHHRSTYTYTSDMSSTNFGCNACSRRRHSLCCHLDIYAVSLPYCTVQYIMNILEREILHDALARCSMTHPNSPQTKDVGTNKCIYIYSHT